LSPLQNKWQNSHQKYNSSANFETILFENERAFKTLMNRHSNNYWKMKVIPISRKKISAWQIHGTFKPMTSNLIDIFIIYWNVNLLFSTNLLYE